MALRATGSVNGMKPCAERKNCCLLFTDNAEKGNIHELPNVLSASRVKDLYERIATGGTGVSPVIVEQAKRASLVAAAIRPDKLVFRQKGIRLW